ncbi:hypothetical protein EUGRSUZ_F02631 [Eucalyptus grandis]|uniref:Uncharacterized protein n=2 Tax=Eucalyptus grandis TaxID=71139 RepID=A0ACC3KJA3_EUCGR|nr:hypothetical protein EUGRSUZ_F02631 [Eucalyptus grandis]
MMDCASSAESCGGACAYGLLLSALSLVPIWHYALGACLGFVVVLYRFLECHLLEDLVSRLRSSPPQFTFNSSSDVYAAVVSKCRILHGKYLATPWLASPHLQTVFLNFFGRPPSFSYRRQMFRTSDGGTIALDWVLSSDVSGGAFHRESSISKDDTTPIVVVVPGLTSDSCSAYLKHLAFNTAKSGWNVVVSNHRGLGGVSVTSDCFYNAGWTEDVRVVIDYLHNEYPKATLFVVGTSIGANILVKYLGEEGENIPVAGAVAVCSPWDLLIGDRFISRGLRQKLYDRALTIGLQGYAQLHQPRYSRLADWEGIRKSRSIRDFDNYATCLVGKFETADTYYRRCSSANYVGSVAVPLLCISALDDPVCTREAIPWDECRANKNIVLVTPRHGGHLAFFEGITATSLWWVRAVNEFLHVLHSSPCMHVKKSQTSSRHSALESSIDQGPYVNVADGMVAAMGSEHTKDAVVEEEMVIQKTPKAKTEETSLDAEKNAHVAGTYGSSKISQNPAGIQDVKPMDVNPSVLRSINQIKRVTRKSLWLLAYIAVVTSWPIVGSALGVVFKGKLRNMLPAVLRGRQIGRGAPV